MSADFTDVRYEIDAGIARITIDRPEVYNAFRAETCEELIRAFEHAAYSPEVGVVVLSGAGDRAFCTGGDQKAHAEAGGSYGGRGTIGLPVEQLHTAIRDCPKPVIARVQGYAIGGGNVLAALCDLTIAGENAVFGQVGPKMGSVDPGFGTAYLARVIGEKKARELWFLCRRYSAAEAVEMGLANIAVPDTELDAEVDRWCAELLERSPTALAIAKRSLNADSEHLRGLSNLGMQAVALYYHTDECAEAGAAVQQKRAPDFAPFRRSDAGGKAS